MGDVASGLTDEQMAELSALADGTLSAERRPAVEAWVDASPRLQELVERQRRSLAATRATASEPAPASLRAAVEARVAERRGRRHGTPRLVPQLALGGAAVAGTTVALVLALSGGAAAPTVADAAALAARPPTGPPPAPLKSSKTELATAVDGVQFPDFRRIYGWRAVGERRGRIDGRDAKVVYYRKGGRRIAYAIVSGPGLSAPSGGGAAVRHGVQYQAFRAEGQPAVTWRRVGHTCVLSGAASHAELLALASWRAGGTLPY
jgi:anti-sigma factor RsiW